MDAIVQVVESATAGQMIPQQADSDARLIALWLHQYHESPHTHRAYAADVARFLAAVPKPLRAITLGDLQGFADTLTGSAATRGRTLSAVKSLFAFAHRLGYLQFDVGRVVKLPKREETLSERILAESQVQRMLALEPMPRNAILLRLLYVAGLRVSELCGLRWRDCQARDGGEGQVKVFGKGGKTRVVLLPGSMWAELSALRGEAGEDAPVFTSRERGEDGQVRPLDQSSVNRIVHASAKRAGIAKPVSPHWMRHAHASHAIDHGAPVSLVQATLGHANLATTGRYLHARPNDSSAKYLPG